MGYLRRVRPTEESEIEQLEDNLWRVTGTVELEALSDALGVPLPLEEEYDTLGAWYSASFPPFPRTAPPLTSP